MWHSRYEGRTSHTEMLSLNILHGLSKRGGSVNHQTDNPESHFKKKKQKITFCDEIAKHQTDLSTLKNMLIEL